jgi:hypothetical protein
VLIHCGNELDIVAGIGKMRKLARNSGLECSVGALCELARTVACVGALCEVKLAITRYRYSSASVLCESKHAS